MTIFIGLMSGTSVDSIDVVAVDLSEHPPKLIGAMSYPMPEKMIEQVHHFYDTPTTSLRHIGECHVQFGQVFADAVEALLARVNLTADDITAIGSHGQTIYHHPKGPLPFSMQLGDPNVIAARTNITTVANFRNKDMALGGQGAPLTPFFHEAIFRMTHKNRAVVNIGGIANITLLPGDLNAPISGYDTGPGNTLMDRWIEQQLQKPFDDNGQWAESGMVLPKLLETLLADPYFHKATPKSTGREYFHLSWLEKNLTGLEIAPDVQCTLTELTAQSIANAVNASDLDDLDIIICGGGVHNGWLMERLSACCDPWPVLSSKDLGVDPNWVEAMAFAWFAQQTLEKRALNLSAVTGASKPAVLGGVYC